MKRNIDFNEEKRIQNKKQKTEENSILKEETSLLLSMVDTNILQNIFIDLVNQYQYSIYQEKEIKKAFTLLLNFSLTCKLFENISKQPLFPLILNNINTSLKYKQYLKILFIKQEIEQLNFYKEKDINDLFYYSCLNGYYDLINPLIKYGANINHKNINTEWSPLILVSYRGSKKTAKKLIKSKNLNINQQEKISEKTALMYACQNKKENIVKILISRKDIDISLKDKYQISALDIAKEENYQNIVKILENHQK